jgi:hypothetical protein
MVLREVTDHARGSRGERIHDTNLDPPRTPPAASYGFSGSAQIKLNGAFRSSLLQRSPQASQSAPCSPAVKTTPIGGMTSRSQSALSFRALERPRLSPSPRYARKQRAAEDAARDGSPLRTVSELGGVLPARSQSVPPTQSPGRGHAEALELFQSTDEELRAGMAAQFSLTAISAERHVANYKEKQRAVKHTLYYNRLPVYTVASVGAGHRRGEYRRARLKEKPALGRTSGSLPPLPSATADMAMSHDHDALKTAKCTMCDTLNTMQEDIAAANKVLIHRQMKQENEKRREEMSLRKQQRRALISPAAAAHVTAEDVDALLARIEREHESVREWLKPVKPPLGAIAATTKGSTAVAADAVEEEVARSESADDRARRNMPVVRIYVLLPSIGAEEEEEILRATVFPQLRKLCSERKVAFMAVHFKPFSDTTKLSAVADLLHRFREIDACRPYFICVMNAQTGWLMEDDGPVPVVKKQLQEALYHYKWIDRDSDGEPDFSLFELQVRYALLHNGGCRRPFVYFRAASTASAYAEKGESPPWPAAPRRTW